jgi:hypothetical protein
MTPLGCPCTARSEKKKSLDEGYSYRLIGKLTAFLQLREFSQRNLAVNSFTFAARLSFSSSKVKLAWLSLNQQPSV